MMHDCSKDMMESLVRTLAFKLDLGYMGFFGGKDHLINYFTMAVLSLRPL